MAENADTMSAAAASAAASTASLPSSVSGAATSAAPNSVPAAQAPAGASVSPSPDNVRATSGAPPPPQPQPQAALGSHSSPSPSGDHKFAVANGSTANGAAAATATSTPGNKGKRVFVFQKRWLHSLPIMEKTLPEATDAGGTIKKNSADEPVASSSSSSSPTGSVSTAANESSREVIACMLCDEPGSSSHHLTRVWSRMNCRRGRIENHLMSKHPEFMLLLKHKRDSEGDLSVQLFLQGMRDGRCNIRSEINLGLYNHIQSLNAHANADASSSALAASLISAGIASSTSSSSSMSAEAAAAIASSAELAQLQQSAKRGFPGANVYTIQDSSSSENAADSANASDRLLSIFPPLGGASKVTLELLELESRRKRARLSSAQPHADVSSAMPAGGVSVLRGQTAALSGVAVDGGATAQQSDFQVGPDAATTSAGIDEALEASVFAQWQSVFFNKLIVVTGGENEYVTSLATNLWLLGANVLLTFTNISALAEFTASHAARFPDPEPSSTATSHGRGVMRSILCSFQTRQQIDEWSKSVADKFSRVDFLINFVDEEAEKKKSGAAGQEQHQHSQQADGQSESQQQQQPLAGEETGSAAGEYLVSSANRLLELCQSISKLCFQSSGSGSIINITTQSDGVRRNMNCAAIESMTKSLALELQPLNVQVNCILLQQTSSAAADTKDSEQPPLQPPQDLLTAHERQNSALSHTILFLLSPASVSVSGSVLRLQHRVNSLQPPPRTGGSSSSVTAPQPATIHVVGGSAAPSEAESAAAVATGSATHADEGRPVIL